MQSSDTGRVQGDCGVGKQENAQSDGSFRMDIVTHEYPKPILPYMIRISTEEDDALWGFQDAMHEVDVLDFDCSGCPSLRFLGFLGSDFV